MSRFAFEWAKAQQPGDVEAKIVLLILGDHAEGSDSTCELTEGRLADLTGVERAAVPEVIKRLEVAGYLGTTVQPPFAPRNIFRTHEDDAEDRKRGRWIKFNLLIPDDCRSLECSSFAPHPSIGGENRDATAVYRLYDPKGVLLYVGISENPDHRFVQHQLEQPWWFEVATREITWHPSGASANAEERRAIKQDCPVYNIKHSSVPLNGGEKPPKRRYVKENARHGTFTRVLERMRSELQAGRYDIGALPSTDALVNQFDVGWRLIDQVQSELRRSGEITYLAAERVYIRDWSEW